MALNFVDSTATGANDGSSWTDAWTALSSSTGVPAGDEVRVKSSHVETISANLTLNYSNGTFTNPVTIRSVTEGANADGSLDTDTAGAGTTATGAFDLTLDGNIRSIGMHWMAGDDITLSAGHIQQYYGGKIGFTRDVTGHDYNISATSAFEFYGVHFDASVITGADYPHINALRNSVLCYGCHFDKIDRFTLGFNDDPRSELVVISSYVNNMNSSYLVDVTAGFARCYMRDIRLGTSVTNLVNGTLDNAVDLLFERVVNGTVTVPALGLTELQTRRGTVTSTLSIYRTGGADDGEQANAHAWTIAGNANSDPHFPVYTPWLAIWNDGGASITITVYVAHNAVGGASGKLVDNEFGLEVSGPDSDNPSFTDGEFDDGRPSDTLQTTTRVGSDDASSTWNGSGVGTKETVTYTYTPNIAGIVRVRAWVGANITVHIDPKLDVS